jgi:hypothetical protein
LLPGFGSGKAREHSLGATAGNPSSSSASSKDIKSKEILLEGLLHEVEQLKLEIATCKAKKLDGEQSGETKRSSRSSPAENLWTILYLPPRSLRMSVLISSKESENFRASSGCHSCFP